MKNKKMPLKDFINEIKKKGEPIVIIDMDRELKELKEYSNQSILYNTIK